MTGRNRESRAGAMRKRTASLAVLLALAGPAMAGPASVALPGDGAYPESITSTADGTLYVSSFSDGGIFRVKPGASEGEVWVKPGAFGTRSTFGLLADEKTNTLWACSNDLTALGVKGPGDTPGSALKGFDLKTGEGKFSLALPESPSICNDIALAPDGTAYVTNTLRPEIYRVKPGAKAIEVWKTDPLFAQEPNEAGLDGIAFDKDGNLFVNTFTKSKLFKIEVKNGEAGKVTALTPSQPLKFSDAIRQDGKGSLLMVEGGGKLDRVTIEGDKVKIETIKDGFAGGLTGVTIVGDTAYVTEGQLALLTDPEKKGTEPQKPFRVHAIPLTKH